MRDYDPTIDTIERWGEEAFREIMMTGKVDDWTDDMAAPGLRVDGEGTRLVYEDAFNVVDASRKSLLRTVGQQGEEIEQLMIEREDLKSKNDKLRALNNRARLACILFGSVVLILSAMVLM